MGFEPPRCPYLGCANHLDPQPGFWCRRGSYRRRPPPCVVPRFCCRRCRRSFSEQTFRLDYRDRRPETNVPLLEKLISGTSLRHSGRLLRLSPRAVQMKFRKIARTLASLHTNLLRSLPADRTLQYDELETFETRSIWRLSVGVLLDRASRFVIDATVAPIRRQAARGTRRHRWEQHDELRYGRRRDLSRARTKRTFQRLRQLLAGQRAHLQTDEKGAYAALVRELFGNQVVHERTPARLARRTFNPLFPINHMHATMRERNGRLHLRSWLVSKRAQQLQQQLVLEHSWRNFCWQRFNRDQPDETPAVLLGLVSRRLDAVELLRWRQDWGEASCHPLSQGGEASVLARL
jgi:transposase-like protein